MKTSKPLTHQTTLDELIFSQEDSLANPSQTQDLEKERKMNATYGVRCLESFGKFPRATLWAKTFAAYLIGQGEFSSSKCALTWKLKATKLHRIYFQLRVKTHPTEEIEFGLLQMLPTPTAFDYESPRKVETFKKAQIRHKKKGVNLQKALKQMAESGELPLPPKTKPYTDHHKTFGKTSRLNPLFVEEMMGFPKNWTALPFQSGEKKVLKPTETP